MVKSSARIRKSVLARDQILSWIRKGRLTQGQRLPSEMQLARLLGISHPTVRRGLVELQKEGLITKKPRVGNFLQGVTPAELVRRVVMALPRTMIAMDMNLEPEFDLNRDSSLDQQDEDAGLLGQHPGAGLLLAGAMRTLGPQSYALTPVFYDKGEGYFAAQVAEPALEHNVRGVLVGPQEGLHPDELAKLTKAGVYVVLLRPVPQLNALHLPTVDVPTAQTLIAILEGLVARGHRKIRVCLYEHSPQVMAMDRALEQACANLGLGSASEVRLRIPNSPPKVNLMDLDKLLEGPLEDMPTALVVPDEVLAVHVARRCYHRNWRLPDDLSLAAVADHFPSTHTVPLTAADAADLNLHSAQVAAGLLNELIEGRPLNQRVVSLPSPVHWRQSVGPPRANT